MAAARAGLKFSPQAGGFTLLPHGQLISGDLTVFDLRGQAAFRSSYDAAASQWSRPRASGLKERVYGYEFRGQDGTTLRGRISLLYNL